MRRLRLLEEENARLKKIVAQQALDIDALKVVLSKKSGRPAGGTRGRAGGLRRGEAERATRQWSDSDEPRELALRAEKAEAFKFKPTMDRFRANRTKEQRKPEKYHLM